MCGAIALGTTSACAENTTYHTVTHITHWNYLRVRGEYPDYSVGTAIPMELPPRARRILPPWIVVCNLCGTTSACAENTLRLSRNHFSTWNYLRVRGEYCSPWGTMATPQELPPRARRILAENLV